MGFTAVFLSLLEIRLYRTTFVRQEKLDLKNFDGVYFASGSCVDAFIEIYGKIPPHLVLYVGGRATFDKLLKMNEENRTILVEKLAFD